MAQVDFIKTVRKINFLIPRAKLLPGRMKVSVVTTADPCDFALLTSLNPKQTKQLLHDLNYLPRPEAPRFIDLLYL